MSEPSTATQDTTAGAVVSSTFTLEPCGYCGSRNVHKRLDEPAIGEAGAFTLTCDDCPCEFHVPAATTSRSRIQAVRAIVKHHKAARIDGYIIDVQTAGLLVAVYNALSPANRERFGNPDLYRLVDLGWKHAR